MPRQTEPSANNALGALLKGMMHSCDVQSETVRAVVDQPGLQPDILITDPSRSPVVIEAEYEPARNVEAEAKSRLGLDVVGGRRKVEAVIALRYPEDVADSDDLRGALADARLSFCALYSDPDESRFPESGWLSGSVSDLADFVRLVSVPLRAVEAATKAMVEGIDGGAALLDRMDETRPFIPIWIARLLGMSNVPQTRRMACAIVTNAMVFHERLEGIYEDIQTLDLICGNGSTNPQWDILATWRHILGINYWPIFAVARDIIRHLPSGEAAQLLRRLHYTAGEVNAAGVDNAHDLTGRVFQRLIADRKYLATFYTLPSSAALLARLAVAKLNGTDWSDADAIGEMRVADLACGTGALLSAVYEQMSARHERAGGDPVALHRVMMEEVLYGCDVMPSAIHITGSTLAGVHPNVGFNNSRLYTPRYGRQEDDSVAIGSLELLRSEAMMTNFNPADPAMRTGSAGQETAAHIVVDVPDEGYDLVIMNPPFTRATNHEGAHADITNPAFAAFDATPADQTAMGKRINEFGKDTCYHGNAGIASSFAALAHKKLKPGGVLALVLPLSAAAGLSWQKFRRMIAAEYVDVTVLSIAANGKDMSFSSDTGMGECLVVARKRKEDEPAAGRADFVSLRRRPHGFAQASAVAQSIIGRKCIRRLEDGPYGGERLVVGDDIVGEMLNASIRETRENWGGVRTLDYSLAQTADALSHSKLWLPGQPEGMDLRMDELNAVGKLGLLSRDITGPLPRGPFDKYPPNPTATYPALWNHDAKKETRMVCKPDSELVVRRGMEDKSIGAWATRSRAHLNASFTFGSQPLAVAFTVRESLGGSMWPNVIFADERLDYAFTVWGNSTLGLFVYWWHSSRQQSSKVTVSIRSAETLPMLDFRTLTDEQLATAESIFDEFRDKELEPAYLADADPNRALLDRRVVCDLLGFDDGVYEGVRKLAAKWCAEPSVHGGKARPRGARLVV